MGLLPSVLAILAITAAVASDGDEAAALLAFKAEASGHQPGALASWNGSTGPCSWEGVTCSRSRAGSPRRVVALSLPSYGLTGTLAPAVGNLTFLQTLNLSYNWLRGELPSSLGRLRRLQTLDLSYNSFSGTLPANLSSCISMAIMDIDSNQLDGRVPAELGGALVRLQVLWLPNNSFTGPVPASLANLSSLQYLSLEGNQLDGSIPSGLSVIHGLRVLDFSANRLSGLLPPPLYNLSSLVTFQVAGNLLHGSIPADVGTRFPSARVASWSSNQFSGVIPSSLSNLSALEMLGLSYNRFRGHVPPTLGRLQALKTLHLSDNRLEADNKHGWEFITSLANCSQLQVLSFSNNSFRGQLPNSLVNLSTTLQQLTLGDNRISGGIPSDIGNLVGLSSLTVVNTSLSGVIPDSIGKLANLVDLAIYSNQLSGLIPPSLGNLSRLSRLSARYNNLEGPIPATLGKLKNLILLNLSNNFRLNGSIPKQILELSSLSWYLDLSYNSLSGSLPSEVGSLANLNHLILSANRLSGQIPASIGNCMVLESLLLRNNSFDGSIPQSLKNIKGLSRLNLTMNKLSGSIPDELGSISGLTLLDLSRNNLSGPIPTALQNLRLLSRLDVSFNDLQGEVPTGGVFRNLTYLSVAGNNLCGGIPQLHLAPCSTNPVNKNKKHWSKSLMIVTVTTGAIVLISAIVLIWLLHGKIKQRQRGQVAPPAIEEQYQRISYHSLFRGTHGFSEANLLGEGRYGMVYKCTLDNDHTQKTIAVKVFNLQQSGSSKSFEAECEALRTVRHRCLIKIITCCSSINPQGQEFKALLFEFMPNGSLDSWLHPKSQMIIPSNTLSLAQRMDIAVDIVDAVDYLHNHCQPPIIHCDLKPSNILLDEDMSARVGDFGISKILPQDTSKTLVDSVSSMGVRGSIGYVAPEYGEGCAVSTIGDVYSLGILLLEMFTGRSPTDDMFRDSLDLHKFAEAAVPNRVMQIADPTIWLHSDANDMNPADASTASSMKECLVSAIELGISCSKQPPKERMLIRDAAVEMHAIRDAYLNFCQLSGGGMRT